MLATYMMGPALERAELDPQSGKPVKKIYRWGAQLEPDPDCPGYARLKQLRRGSPVRQGKSYCALGLPDDLFPVTVPGAGITADLNFRDAIQEPGYLGYLYVMGVPAAPTLFVIDVSRGGDSQMSGNVPASMFERDSVYSPIFGHYIDTNTQLTIQFRNDAVAPINVAPGFSLL